VTFVIGIGRLVVTPFASLPRRFIVAPGGTPMRKALSIALATASLLLVVAATMLACNKKDDSSASPSSSAAAPAGSGEADRRGHEHEWGDGGHGDHGDHAR
jgi:hypothetical protein